MGNGLVTAVQLPSNSSNNKSESENAKKGNEKNILQNREPSIDHTKVKEQEEELRIKEQDKKTENKAQEKAQNTTSSSMLMGIEALSEKTSSSSNFKLPLSLKSSSTSSFLGSPPLTIPRKSHHAKNLSSDESSSSSKQSRQLAQLVDATRYDEIISWLDWEFRKADINQDGNLEYHEFFRFMKALDLRLTNAEIFSFYSYADTDRDGIVVWSEILKDIPNILKHIYKGLPPGIHDWCLMSQEGMEILYFNKRTGIATSTKPAILSDVVSPSTIANDQTKQEVSSSSSSSATTTTTNQRNGQNLGKEISTTKVEMNLSSNSSSSSSSKVEVDYASKTANLNQDVSSVEDKEKAITAIPSSKTPSKADHTTSSYDTILTWLDWEFHKADLDSNGFLSKSEFLRFVSGLELGLTKKECDTFYTYADLDGDGKIVLSEVTELAPQILQKIYESIEPGPKDWCKITRQEEAWVEREVEIDTGEKEQIEVEVEVEVEVEIEVDGAEDSETNIDIKDSGSREIKQDKDNFLIQTYKAEDEEDKKQRNMRVTKEEDLLDNVKSNIDENSENAKEFQGKTDISEQHVNTEHKEEHNIKKESESRKTIYHENEKDEIEVVDYLLYDGPDERREKVNSSNYLIDETKEETRNKTRDIRGVVTEVATEEEKQVKQRLSPVKAPNTRKKAMKKKLEKQIQSQLVPRMKIAIEKRRTLYEVILYLNKRTGEIQKERPSDFIDDQEVLKDYEYDKSEQKMDSINCKSIGGKDGTRSDNTMELETQPQGSEHFRLFNELNFHDEKKYNHRLSALQLAIGEEEREVKQKLQRIQARIQNERKGNTDENNQVQIREQSKEEEQSLYMEEGKDSENPNLKRRESYTKVSKNPGKHETNDNPCEMKEKEEKNNSVFESIPISKEHEVELQDKAEVKHKKVTIISNESKENGDN